MANFEIHDSRTFGVKGFHHFLNANLRVIFKSHVRFEVLLVYEVLLKEVNKFS